MVTLLALLPTRLAPCNELTQVTQIITNRNRAHILRLLQVHLIQIQSLDTSLRDGRLAYSFHRILLSEALADMHKRGHLEH